MILNLDSIEPFSHWITPDIEVKRFDTRFFIAYIPSKQTEKHDGTELTESLWISPKKALELSSTGQMPMIMPTTKTLEQCLKFDSGKDLLEHQSKLTNDEFNNYLSMLKFILIVANKLKVNRDDKSLVNMPNYLELESLSANLTQKNLIDRFDYLTNNQKELFSLNLDKKIFILNFLTQ